MILQPHFQALVEKISPDSPAGIEIDASNQDLDFIQTELMKRGSLQHSSIKWPEVKSRSISLLTTTSKSLHAVSGLCNASCQEDGFIDFDQLLETVAQLLHHFQNDICPRGERKKRIRQSQLDDICRCISASIGKVASNLLPKDLSAAIEHLYAEMVALDYNTDAVNKLSSSIPAATESQQTADIARGNDSDDIPLQSAAPLDSRTRKELLNLASKIFSHNPEMVISFQMHRSAAWQSPEHIPKFTDQLGSNVPNLPKFVSKEFIDGLETPSIARLKRLEERLTLTPNWMDGHYLAFQYANRLGLSQAAMAIKNQCQLHVKTYPLLLKAVDDAGAPICSNATLQWLSAEDTVSVDASPWHQALNDADGLGLEEGLSIIARHRQDDPFAAETRHQLCWTICHASWLRSNKQVELAKMLIEPCLRQLELLNVANWEPSLVEWAMSELTKCEL